jgi:hypothetical protein
MRSGRFARARNYGEFTPAPAFAPGYQAETQAMPNIPAFRGFRSRRQRQRAVFFMDFVLTSGFQGVMIIFV